MRSISEYHRPADLAEALALLGRSVPVTRPLGGGTHYRRGWPWPEAVVDLSALDLAGVIPGDLACEIGATTTLAQLAAVASLPAALRQAALRQASRNSRQRATVGGVIATRDSGTLLVCLLALDARLRVAPGGRLISLQSYLQQPEEGGHLITALLIPTGRTCAFHEISRTPADAPILAVAVGAVVGGTGLRGVIAAGGGADQPILVLPGAGQLLEAAADPQGTDLAALAAATSQTPWRSDARGTAEYRAAMTPLLLQRGVMTLAAGREASHAG